MKNILTGLLILFVLGVLIAGAIACWNVPRTAPPTPWASGTECPSHDRANPWCQR